MVDDDADEERHRFETRDIWAHSGTTFLPLTSSPERTRRAKTHEIWSKRHRRMRGRENGEKYGEKLSVQK